MPHMSVFELLFALLLVCVLTGVAGVAVLAWSLVRRADGQAVAVAELRQRLETGGLTQESQASEMRERLAQTQSVVERLGSALVARQSIEDEARSSLKRLESVIAGSSTRGAAGENILEEVLKHLPPEMLQRNVWVGGKVVELALQLPGGKLLPIDSKWVSSGALEQLAEPGLDAPHRRHVMVVGYAMALPYLLTLYQLHLQFARTVDMEKLQSALIDVERHLDTLEAILDNKLQRALTMLQNTYSEGKQVSARIRSAAQSVQTAENGAHEVSTEPLSLALLDSVQ